MRSIREAMVAGGVVKPSHPIWVAELGISVPGAYRKIPFSGLITRREINQKRLTFLKPGNVRKGVFRVARFTRRGIETVLGFAVQTPEKDVYALYLKKEAVL